MLLKAKMIYLHDLHAKEANQASFLATRTQHHKIITSHYRYEAYKLIYIYIYIYTFEVSFRYFASAHAINLLSLPG
jgi:hypothetical protein